MKKLEIKEPQNWHQNDHPEDVARILRILEKHGYMASKPQATRLAVLVDTPAPQTLYQDLVVLVRSASEEHADAERALVGVVTEEGELQRRHPFAAAYPKPVLVHANVGLQSLPEDTRDVLRRALASSSSGIVLFGASEIVDHTAYDQLAAGLALTEHAGPAARIMPRHRGTPAKDWLVPEPIKALPFLPSIESAYAQGYRRMVITPHYSRGEVLVNYDDVLFLGGTYHFTVADITMKLVAGMGRSDAAVMERVVAVLGLLQIPTKRGQAVASDLFVRGTSDHPIGTEYDQFKAFLQANRVCRWEEELASLLETGAVSETAIRKSNGRDHVVKEFLAQRNVAKKAS